MRGVRCPRPTNDSNSRSGAAEQELEQPGHWRGGACLALAWNLSSNYTSQPHMELNIARVIVSSERKEILTEYTAGLSDLGILTDD